MVFKERKWFGLFCKFHNGTTRTISIKCWIIFFHHICKVPCFIIYRNLITIETVRADRREWEWKSLIIYNIAWRVLIKCESHFFTWLVSKWKLVSTVSILSTLDDKSFIIINNGNIVIICGNLAERMIFSFSTEHGFHSVKQYTLVCHIYSNKCNYKNSDCGNNDFDIFNKHFPHTEKHNYKRKDNRKNTGTRLWCKKNKHKRYYQNSTAYLRPHFFECKYKTYKNRNYKADIKSYIVRIVEGKISTPLLKIKLKRTSLVCRRCHKFLTEWSPEKTVL